MAMKVNWKEEEYYCNFARALMKGKNCDYMDQYLLGPLAPNPLAKMIHHNNTFHNGDTAEQMGQLCDIVDERKKVGLETDKQMLIISVRNNLVEIQNQNSTAPICQMAPAPYSRTGSRAIPDPLNRMSIKYHQHQSQSEFLNFNSFILNPYDPTSGKLPVFTVSRANYDQQNVNGEVMITGVIPVSKTTKPKRRSRKTVKHQNKPSKNGNRKK